MLDTIYGMLYNDGTLKKFVKQEEMKMFTNITKRDGRVEAFDKTRKSKQMLRHRSCHHDEICLPAD